MKLEKRTSRVTSGTTQSFDVNYKQDANIKGFVYGQTGGFLSAEKKGLIILKHAETGRTIYEKGTTRPQPFKYNENIILDKGRYYLSSIGDGNKFGGTATVTYKIKINDPKEKEEEEKEEKEEEEEEEDNSIDRDEHQLEEDDKEINITLADNKNGELEINKNVIYAGIGLLILILILLLRG